MTRVNEYGQPIGPDVPGWTAREVPTIPVLAGRFVRLEALAPEHDGPLFAALATADDTLWTYLPIGPCHTVQAWAHETQRMRDNPDYVPYALLVDGGPLGIACYLRLQPTIGVIEVGGIVLSPALQRTSASTEAQYLLARHVFEDLGYRRYEWKCDALNAPSRRAALRLGFTYEGTWRNAIMYKGRSRDTAWYAMTDADWLRLRPAYDEWLGQDLDDRRARVSLGTLTAAALAGR